MGINEDPKPGIEGDSGTGSAADSFMREIARAPDVVAKSVIGRTVGRYRIEALLGQGGMGSVYEAEDIELGRRVAIKLLRPELSGESRSTQRFVRERRVTAELEHPGIVPVYDVGISSEDEPYYVMRIARGDPFDRLIERVGTLEGRLALLPNLVAVADAVAFAHSRGIVHRDLKPANVLIGAFGETLVADWGIAKRLGAGAPVDAPQLESATSDEGATRDGVAIGTRAYMPPEQAEGRSVDERADVYALGAMLHHLVIGRPPREGDLAHPGMRGATAAVGDLLAIVRKAIAPDPGSRYQRAADLAEELRRFQTGQILIARAYTRVELVLRWARRHRAQLSVAAVLGVILLVVVVLGVIRIVRERNVALAERARADAARQDVTQRNEELVLLQARAELTRDPTASLAWLKRYPPSARDWPTAARIAADAWSRQVASQVWNLGVPLGSVAFSPDGRTIAAGAIDGTFVLIDVETGGRRTYHAPDGVGDRVAFSSDGRWAATTDGVETVRLWDLAVGDSRHLVGEHAGGPTLRFSPDGSMLLARHTGGGARLWRVPSGDPVGLPGDADRLVAFVPGSPAVAIARGAALEMLDTTTGVTTASTRLDGPAFDLYASGDGRWVAASRPGALTLWSPATGTVRKVVVGKDAVRLLTSSRDGRQFMSCGSMGTPDLWLFDAAQATARQFSTEERCTRQAFEFSPDATLFISAGYGGELRLHDVVEGRTRLLIGHESTVADAAFSPDGRLIASASSDRTLRLWRIGEGDVRVLHGIEGLDRISARNEVLVQDTSTGAISLVDVRSGVARSLTEPGTNSALRGRGALSLDGRIALFYESERKIVVWDLPANARRTIEISGGTNADVFVEALSAHGAQLAQLDARGAINLVDLATGRTRELARLDDRGFAVAWSSDEHLVAAGGRDGTARVWDVASGVERAHLRVGGWVWSVAFSRDGTRLGAACTDGIVRVVDLASGAVIELPGHVGTAAGIDFTPDGQRVLSSGADGTVRIWDLATRSSTVVRREPETIGSVAFSADGSLVMIKTVSGKVRIWDAQVVPPLGGVPAELARWVGTATSAEVDERGRVQTP